MPAITALAMRAALFSPGWSASPYPVRWLGAALALAVGPGLAPAAESAEAQPPLQKVVSRVGMNRLAFAGLNENDAKASYKVLSSEVGRKLGYDLTIEMTLFDSLGDFAQAIRDRKINFISVSTWDLFSMDVGAEFEVKFVVSTSGSIAHRWLLLTRRDSGLRSLADLKGKSVISLRNNTASLGAPWIETCLLEQGFGPPGTHFGKLETVAKPSAVILPVFFGKAHACIVDQASFDIMVEMNPQVGQMLEPVARSDSMVNSVISISRTAWPTEQSLLDLIRGLANLDNEPAGRQILTLFKSERLIPYEPAQLESVTRLFARHRELLRAQKP